MRVEVLLTSMIESKKSLLTGGANVTKNVKHGNGP